MKYNVTRSYTHFECSEIEAKSYEEATELAKSLDEEERETDANA